MSIHTNRKLSELENQCKELQIEVIPEGKKLGKTDYVLALRKHFLDTRYPSGKIPKGLEIILSIDTPMLCQQMKILSEQEQNEIWDSRDWYLEEKIDGNRMVLINVGGELTSYSRNNSLVDYLPIEYTDNLPKSRWGKLKSNMVIDTEIISIDPNI